ncbi:alpha-galactosidase [Phycicoccus sp. Soil802]|nr:alpha-galactosidase [Phycicoccus sp. Soil802]
MAEAAREDVVHLFGGGTSLLLRLHPTSFPSVLHWGPTLAETETATGAHSAHLTSSDVLSAWAMPPTDSVVSTQEAVSVLPQHSTGWLGRPGILGSRSGRAWSVLPSHVEHRVDSAGTIDWPEGPVGAVRVLSVGTDEASELEIHTEIELDAAGLVRLRASVRNNGDDPFDLTHLDPALPVPSQASELLDLTGRHAHERHPQRRTFDIGVWLRESWGGRPGHDSATVLCAGVKGFSFRSGRVWGVHLAWSGNQSVRAERSITDWRFLRGGEVILPGEVALRRGEEYVSPWLCGSWGDGLDELSARFHRHLRQRHSHPRTTRPVLLNTWEAVYFDHDLGRLLELADRAAECGVERFVLDDGWFLGRRDDTAGLGDWVIDPAVWPDGLRPLVDHVHRLGMDFGLWFEPEMVNLDSNLAREHPEWLLATNHGPGIASRHQHVLDLTHTGAYDHVLAQMSSLIAEYGVAYIKWDHNRPLIDAGHQPGGEPAVRLQTLAVYRLMAELKERHPGLEIESCAGGGARIDLGMAEVTDRVWPSDCIDAHERHRIVRWTGLILPPELMGTHVGSGADHTTGRTHDLQFRAGTALWGHLGIEWDLTRATDAELSDLRRWIQLHKELRPLLHSGDVVHADVSNPAVALEGVVAANEDRAVYRLSLLEHSLAWPLGRVQLPGLDPQRRYRVTVVGPEGAYRGIAMPGWAETGVELSGALLGEVGLQSPLLAVDQMVLLHAQAV